MLSKSTAGTLAGPPTTGLVLERLPNGELAWLRAELDTAIRDADLVDQVLARRLGHLGGQQPDEVRYTITQAGRDYLARERAIQALFGQPWPTVAEAMAIGVCRACHHLREHRGSEACV